MITKAETKRLGRTQRHNRIRAKISGTQVRPRLSVYKSNRYLHAQLIDDTKGVTLVALSSKGVSGKTKTAAATTLGTELARLAKEKGIGSAVFDRGGFRFAGRVAALATAAREGGLAF